MRKVTFYTGRAGVLKNALPSAYKHTVFGKPGESVLFKDRPTFHLTIWFALYCNTRFPEYGERQGHQLSSPCVEFVVTAKVLWKHRRDHNVRQIQKPLLLVMSPLLEQIEIVECSHKDDQL